MPGAGPQGWTANRHPRKRPASIAINACIVGDDGGSLTSGDVSCPLVEASIGRDKSEVPELEQSGSQAGGGDPVVGPEPGVGVPEVGERPVPGWGRGQLGCAGGDRRRRGCGGSRWPRNVLIFVTADNENGFTPSGRRLSRRPMVPAILGSYLLRQHGPVDAVPGRAGPRSPGSIVTGARYRGAPGTLQSKIVVTCGFGPTVR